MRPEGFEPPAYCSVADRDQLLELHELEEAAVWPPVIDYSWNAYEAMRGLEDMGAQLQFPRPRPASDSIGFALVGIA